MKRTVGPIGTGPGPLFFKLTVNVTKLTVKTDLHFTFQHSEDIPPCQVNHAVLEMTTVNSSQHSMSFSLKKRVEEQSTAYSYLPSPTTYPPLRTIDGIPLLGEGWETPYKNWTTVD